MCRHGGPHGPTWASRQIAAFAQLYPDDARLPQPLNGRIVTEPAEGARHRALSGGYWTFCTAGSAALMAETPSTPAILQIGCEKSFARLGTVTRPM
jgi:hypothetical protein